jgi:hypothetical protein
MELPYKMIQHLVGLFAFFGGGQKVLAGKMGNVTGKSVKWTGK